MTFSRIFKNCAIVFLLTALVHSAFAQQHGVVFDITTTSTSYSTANNSYDASSTSSGVRLRFVASKTGMYRFRFEEASSGDYYVYKCPDSTYTSCGSSIANIYSSNRTYSQTISVGAGDSVFYLVQEAGTLYSSYPFSVYYEKPYVVTFNGKDTSVFSGSYASVDASSLLSPTKAFLNWKRISGAGTFSDSTAVSTKFYPTLDAELGIDTKTVTVNALTDKFKSYVYNADGYQKNGSGFAVRTSFTATDSGYYILFVKPEKYSYGPDVYNFGTDSSFSSLSSQSCGSTTCRITFSSNAGAKTYFELYQSYSAHNGDSVDARVEKAIGVYAEPDSVGKGYAYVGVNSSTYDVSHVKGDTVALRSSANSGFKFSHWTKSSGTCTIVDSTKATTSVVIETECHVKAVFNAGTVYPITNKSTDYTSAEHYFSQSASSGVRFMFVAPSDGAYEIKFARKDSATTFVYYKYPTSAFYTPSTYSSFTSSISDSVYMNKGDTAFYIVRPDYNSDSLKVFSAVFSTLKSYKVTLTTSSAQCSTSVKSQNVVEGATVSFLGYANKGYRPEGFTLEKGTATISTSLPDSVTLKVKSDVTLKLTCGSANLIDITSKETYRTADKDFYEQNPSVGLRYRYVAPGTAVYIIRAKTKYANGSYFEGYYYRYADSSLTSYSNYLYLSGSYMTRNYVITPSKQGDEYYFGVVPYGTLYYDDSVAVYAIKAAFVDVEGKAYRDTVAIGDSLLINATSLIDTGYSFAGWKLSFGSGKFTDSTLMSSYFIPSSDSAKVVVNKKKGQVYTLTDKFSDYTYYANGTQVTGFYGVRTKYTPASNGTYIMITQSEAPWYYYFYNRDSLFYSYYTRNSYSYSATAPSKNEMRYTFNGTKDSTVYFLFVPYSNTYMKDSVWAKVIKTAKITVDTVGGGYVYLNGSSYMSDSSHVTGDTLTLSANPNSDRRFDRWVVSSGKCTIVDSTKKYTLLVVKGDCNVKAFFKAGTYYPITATPTAYTAEEHYYSVGPTYGIRFTFKAPSSGNYTIVASWANTRNFTYYRSADSTLSPYDAYRTTNTFADSMWLDKDSVIYVKITPSSYIDTTKQVWISYSTSKAILTLTADSNGSVSPYSYNPAWIGAKYTITASADYGYRFDSWDLVTGSATIDDKRARTTLASIKKQSEVIAHFRKGDVQQLAKKKKTFNYLTHYYSDRTGSAVFFTWTPPDSAWYMVHIESTKKLAAYWYDFGTDTTFLTSSSYSVSPTGISGTSATFMFHNAGGKSLYWGLVDSLYNEIPDHEFTVEIATPYVLTVSSEGGGRAIPSGDVGLFPGTDTLLNAVPYGGYTFDKWVKVSGKMVIDDSTSAKTRVKPTSEACEIKATYALDLSTEPSVDISNIDLSDFPGICLGVTVKDKNTDRTIVGLDSTDFVLTQDKKAVPIQVSTVMEVGGVSVAIVVDESGSMSGTSMVQAKESIKQFINEMSGADRTAIVGFTGSAAYVRQSMTSDKSLLLSATNALAATGGTNIVDGTYKGLEQVVGETNPTAVIVFSDGYDGGNSVTAQQTIDYAKSLNTVIHSVAVGSDIPDPLKVLSDGTGGTYTYAPTADKLAAIYAAVKSSVQSRYVICYESPDTTLNGDHHTVVVKTKFLNKSASDTTYWDEDFMPPVVRLTKNTKKLIGVKQKAGDSLDIKVYVSSKDSLASVIMYMRVASTNSNANYTAYPMKHVKDSLWQYVIPGYSVVAPGIDFYVIATNASGVGKAPQVQNPSNEPYTIPVGNNAPEVEFMSVACVDTTGGEGELLFTITDDDGMSSARIYYRNVGTVIFKNKKMTRVTKKGDDWSVSLPNSVFRNDEIEFYVRATDKKGVTARWETFDNNTIAACKDSVPVVADVKDTIRIVNGDKDAKGITRSTESIALTLVTEDFTNKKDTVTVKLACLVSGDVESSIKMVETTSGHYETKNNIEKNEYSVKKEDGKISCAATDTLVATYKDPLYGTYAYDSVAIGDTISISYQFMDEKCKNDLDSVQTSTSAKFCLKVFAPSPSLYVPDTLKLTLFTDQGDTIKVETVETDDYSSEYVYKGSFYFVEDSASLKDSLLDAVLDLDTTFNRVVIQGGISSDKSKLKKRDSLVIFTNYVAADFAEMYDADLDGKADSVRIHFKKPLKKKLASIDTVFWNKAQGTWTTVDTKKIRITEDSTWAEAKVRKAFKYGLTALDSSALPYLRVTKDKSEFSQKTMLVDKVGAVPVKAVKRPGQISMEEYLDASDDVAPDTLEITMSEDIKNTGKKSAWKDLFRYSKTCKDTVEYPIRTNHDPVVDSTGRVWKFVLADYSIMKGYCIMTNPKATYVDGEGNSMGRGGVEIDGRDETVYLYEVSAQQPVHGIGKKGKWIPQGGDSWEEVPDSLTVVKVSSVAPYEANIFIYDNLANVVANMKQKFGYNGEMDSKVRGNDHNRAKVGYLVWNHRSNRDRKVATGVYIWRIDFKFKDGHTEYRILKTGYLRREE